MSCPDICRVCLSVDIKIHSIRDTPFQVIYEGLTNYKLITEDGRPETACYICLSQLQTCLRFQKKSQQTEQILTQLLQNGINMLDETVAILKREIRHDFTITPIEAYNCPKPIVKEEKITNEETSRKINDLAPVESEAAICRVCLVGVKSYPIRSTALQTVYEKLTKFKFLAPDRAESFCYICRCLLMKCYKLLTKAKRSEKILTELLRNGIQLSHETVKLLNSKTKSHLEVAPTECLSYFATALCTVDLSRHNPLSKSNVLPADKKEKELRMKCGVCDRTYLGLDNFKKHMRFHLVTRSFACNLCSYRFLSNNDLYSHKRQVHLTIYKCPKCCKNFSDKKNFNSHVKVHNDIMYECDFCEKLFINQKRLFQHKKYTHNGFKYMCGRCNTPFATELNMKIHIIDAHSNFSSYICDYCDKNFKTKTNLRQHMENYCDRRNYIENKHPSLSIQGQRVFKDKCPRKFTLKTQSEVHKKNHQRDLKCEICKKSFASQKVLKEHIKTHKKHKYTCKMCNAMFSNKILYEKHILQHGGVKSYMCDKCGKKYNMQSKLKMHKYYCNKPKQAKLEMCNVCQKQVKYIHNHMQLHGPKRFLCKFCGKAFQTSSYRTNHHKTHSGLKQFGCDECGTFFGRKHHLKLHLAIHETAKPYKCDLCDAAYSHRAKLLIHLTRKHGEKKAYICDECNASYSEKRSLDCHKRTHTKIHQFICDLCYKVYIDRKDFIIHIKSHRRKKFTCEVCNRRFIEIQKLARHMKQHMIGKSVCPLCKIVINRSRIRRHYHMAHSGVMPYACNVCEKGSNFIDKVYSHYMSCHSKENRYVCELCSNVFKRNTNLRKHMKNKHRRELEYFN